MNSSQDNVVPIRKSESKPNKAGRGDFFAIDSRAWTKVCDLGIGKAVAYLVLANGTGADNRTTSWSVNAIEQYTGMPRGTAKQMIEILIQEELIRQDKGGKRPRYYVLPMKDAEGNDLGSDWIWLPNAIVGGVDGEQNPVDRIYTAHNLAALRLYIELYHAQDLPSVGGVNWSYLCEPYDRERIGERGKYVIWGFSSKGHLTASPSAPFIHLTGKIDKGTKRDAGWPIFWDSLEILRLTGLVDLVGMVLTGDGREAKILHPYDIENGTDGERDIAYAAEEAAKELLDDGMAKRADGLLLLPAEKHLKNVQMVGILRLVYRAKTSATASWYDPTKWENWLTKYREIAGKTVENNVTSSRG
jgi:hypothetical protein